MSEVAFKNLRFDPDITPFHDLARAMAQAFGYTADLELDPQLAQLIRLRVAQLNSCSYCLILHSQTARDRGIAAAKIDGLASWWESALYTDAERAALAYCDALNDGRRRDFETVHAQATVHFSERGIAELAAVVINMNVWTRLKLAQGATPHFEDKKRAEA